MNKTLFCLFLLFETLVLSAQILTTSPLPIVKINTFGLSIPDEPRITVNLQIIWNGPGQIQDVNQTANHYNGVVAIEKRGSSSQSFPKKSYALETQAVDGSNNNVALFGMPAENDWVLYGPYSDKTLIRNLLAYHLAAKSGHYAPRTQMVELLLNGSYQGLYVWMEKIKRDPGRVDIDPLLPTETSGLDLTGGYVIKVDKFTGNSGDGWQSDYLPFPGAFDAVYYQYHDPEEHELHFLQKRYIRDYVEDFENAIVLQSFGDLQQGYRSYADPVSFADYQLHTELTRNVDGYRLSSFLYKDKGGRLKAGPVWDHNLSFGNADYARGALTYGWQRDISYTDPHHCCVPYFWQRIQLDTYYQNLLRCRWQNLREGPWHTDSIFAYVDSLVTILNTGPRQRNFQKWPVLGQYVWPNAYIGVTWIQEINYLKSWISSRVQWMDINLAGTCTSPTPVEEERLEAPFQVLPNPFQDQLQFVGQLENGGTLKLELRDLAGRMVVRKEILVLSHIPLKLNWKMDKPLPAGIYLLHWQLNGDWGTIKVLKH